MVMFIQENVPLSSYSTMRLGGNATYLTEVKERSEVAEAVKWANQHGQKVMMIGEGSNIVWRDEGFQGLVIVNRIAGFEVVREDEQNVYLSIGGGEDWDSVVARTVEKGLNGIAELSLIPGTAGATPVQNVGAYGREISEVLVTVEAFDTQSNQFVTIAASDCGFAYRTSRFKTTDRGRFFITSITIVLNRENPKPPFYDSLQQYFNQNQVTEFNPKVVRDAVIAIRSTKLPDPKKVANNGSFFGNPIVDNQKFTELLTAMPDMKYWHMENDQIKLSAAWLMEQAGFKDYHDETTGMATWPSQTLVFVNEHAKHTSDLLAFKQKVADTVKQQFGVDLVQEPELLP